MAATTAPHHAGPLQSSRPSTVSNWKVIRRSPGGPRQGRLGWQSQHTDRDRGPTRLDPRSARTDKPSRKHRLDAHPPEARELGRHDNQPARRPLLPSCWQCRTVAGPTPLGHKPANSEHRDDITDSHSESLSAQTTYTDEASAPSGSDDLHRVPALELKTVSYRSGTARTTLAPKAQHRCT